MMTAYDVQQDHSCRGLRQINASVRNLVIEEKNGSMIAHIDPEYSASASHCPPLAIHAYKGTYPLLCMFLLQKRSKGEVCFYGNMDRSWRVS